jgi:hypothetical protein
MAAWDGKRTLAPAIAEWSADISGVRKSVMRRLSVLVAICFASACSTNSIREANHPSAEGRWAVRLDGTPVQIVTLVRNGATRWSGSRTTATFQMSMQHSFSKVQGPAQTVPIIWSKDDGPGMLEFKAGTDGDIYTFRVLPDGRALMGWKKWQVKPLVLTRASPNESVPEKWDSMRVYRSEDGAL